MVSIDRQQYPTSPAPGLEDCLGRPGEVEQYPYFPLEIRTLIIYWTKYVKSMRLLKVRTQNCKSLIFRRKVNVFFVRSFHTISCRQSHKPLLSIRVSAWWRSLFIDVLKIYSFIYTPSSAFFSTKSMR